MEFEGALPYAQPEECSTHPSTAILYAPLELHTHTLFSVLGRPTCLPQPILPDFTTLTKV